MGILKREKLLGGNFQLEKIFEPNSSSGKSLIADISYSQDLETEMATKPKKWREHLIR